MNFTEKLQKKSLGFYLAAAAAIVALVSLIVYFVYTGKGGTMNAWVIIALIVGMGCEISLFFFENDFSDFIAIVPAVLFAVALGVMLNGGYGNIADAVEGIVMFGNKDLAGLNYFMAALFLICSILSICSCFIKREKA